MRKHALKYIRLHPHEKSSPLEGSAGNSRGGLETWFSRQLEEERKNRKGQGLPRLVCL